MKNDKRQEAEREEMKVLIPTDWQISTVGSACIIRNDLRMPLSRDVRATRKGKYPYYGPTGILDSINEYRLDGTFALIGEDGDHFLDYENKAQTLLVTGKFNVNNHAHVIESSEICGAEWFYNYFRYRNIKRNLTRQGAGRYKLNKETLERILILIPPKKEQVAINAIFRTWDTAIEKTEKLIEAKEKRRRGLAHKLLFGKARIGKRKTAGFLEKPWFLIPNDWRIVKIGSVAREVSTKNQNGGELPVLSCTKYQGLVDSLKYFDKQIFSKDTSTYKVVEYGQFAYATNHIEEGSIGYQNLYPKGLVSPMYTVFETDKKQVDDGYLFKLLKTETFRHIFEINTSASVDRRGSLRWNEFSKLSLPLPNIDEQRGINTVLETVQRESDLLRRKLELLKKQKRGLMQKLLTGEWRVKAG